MKIIHIFKSTNEKFYKPYYDFIKKNFNLDNHDFIIEKYDDLQSDIYFKKNIDLINNCQYIKLIKKLFTADKIILHSLMSPKLVFILFINPWLLKKCYWTIWGADLYFYNSNKTKIQAKFLEYMRSKIIKKFKGVITHVKGDYYLSKKWYGVTGNYYYSFLYPSNLYKGYNTNNNFKKDSVYVQVGNSADPSNNHKEILDKLKEYKNYNIKIICPLSYGNEEYAQRVIKYGEKNFGDKFVPITKFLPFEQYMNILEKVSVAFFNHNRQQALGNIITLIGLGKKIYIRDDITTWKFCLDHDLTVFNIKGEYSKIFSSLNKDIKEKNIRNIKFYFSKEKLIEDWEIIFNEEV